MDEGMQGISETGKKVASEKVVSLGKKWEGTLLFSVLGNL